MNSENGAIKIGCSETVEDLEQHTREPVYEPLGSDEFDTLLKEITEVVHTQHWEADEAALDEMLMMTDTPVRLHEPCIRQAADTEGTYRVRGIQQQESSKYTGVY